MDATTAVGSVLAAFGLAGAAGLNAWLPLFGAALLNRLDVVDLAAPFDRFSTTTGLVVLATLTVLDLIGDKIPAVDHALHTAGTVIAPLSGAALFTGQTGAETDIPTLVTVVAGGAVAELVHLARAALRAVSTATTGGLGSPVLSSAEDATSLALTAIAFVAPFVAVIGVVAVLAAGVEFWRRRRLRRGLSASRAR
ncbi:MAG: hypothetical protein QOE65_761 [Solirubrobacteraceae bacterium]|jgi:hypothetical protein|nr:hypothetical protein [Solirubrobacteraceae bacterium]